MWLSRFFSNKKSIARNSVINHFHNFHPDSTFETIRLVDDDNCKLIFLVFYRRSMPSRPLPFYAFEYSIESGAVKQLPESSKLKYRPRGYK